MLKSNLCVWMVDVCLNLMYVIDKDFNPFGRSHGFSLLDIVWIMVSVKKM